MQHGIAKDTDNDLLICTLDHEVSELQMQLQALSAREGMLREALDLIRDPKRWERVPNGGRMYTGFMPSSTSDGGCLDAGETADYFLSLADKASRSSDEQPEHNRGEQAAGQIFEDLPF